MSSHSSWLKFTRIAFGQSEPETINFRKRLRKFYRWPFYMSVMEYRVFGSVAVSYSASLLRIRVSGIVVVVVDRESSSVRRYFVPVVLSGSVRLSPLVPMRQSNSLHAGRVLPIRIVSFSSKLSVAFLSL